jgi:hypothetical protein
MRRLLSCGLLAKITMCLGLRVVVARDSRGRLLRITCVAMATAIPRHGACRRVYCHKYEHVERVWA